MLCFLYRFSVVKTVRLQQWICVFLRFLVFLYKYFFFSRNLQMQLIETQFLDLMSMFLSEQHLYHNFFDCWYISSFDSLWVFYERIFHRLKKKPIIFAWNKRPGFYLFHVKNHRMLGITNHQDEKLAAWILIPCAEKCSSRLDFHFFWWYLWVIHPTNVHLSHKQNWKNYFFFILNLKTDASRKIPPHE